MTALSDRIGLAASAATWAMLGCGRRLSMRLLAQNGPMAGGVLTLADGLTLSGPDDARPLCRFRAAGPEMFSIEALDEDAPIFVNGLSVVSRELSARDE